MTKITAIGNKFVEAGRVEGRQLLDWRMLGPLLLGPLLRSRIHLAKQATGISTLLHYTKF